MAIQHPNIFYFVPDASWSSYNSPEFWNKGNVATNNNNNEINKTIYSPSPVGYVEPRTAAFTGFTTTGNDDGQINANGGYNKGWNFYSQPKFQGGTSFFSGLGFRDVYGTRINTSTGGVVAYVSNFGNYWSAGPGTTTNGRNMHFTAASVSPQAPGARAYGCTDYPVSE